VHTIIEKTAALKVLNPECSGDPLTVQRFVDEARAVNRIQHPNIVGIFGFGELADGRKYCVMDLLKGRTLAAHLKDAHRLSAREAIHVLREIALALDAAHAAGVIHRDLKPPNVFLSGSDVQTSRVTLLDFGLARLTGDELRLRTGRGVVVGTPAYMAPEQCSGAELTPSTDVYALGNVAFELLTGRTPFLGPSSAMIAQHLAAIPPAPSAVFDELPAAGDVVFARWLSKAPDLRPPSASSAIRELATALGV
jgi:serine/threonine-protein kinase